MRSVALLSRRLLYYVLNTSREGQIQRRRSFLSTGTMLMRAHVCFTIFLFLHVSLVFSSASPKPEKSVFRGSPKEIFRRRRQACEDGTYLHGGKLCCLCPAGQRVEKHCTTGPNDGKCELCDHNTYNDAPNSADSCQPCTSCSQANANLEVNSSCTAARDTTCRCKSGYFCDRGAGECKICHPCKTCEYGVYKECTQTSDRECHEKSNVIIITVSVIVGLAVAAASIYGGFRFWKWRKEKKRRRDSVQSNPELPGEELKLITEKNLEPFLSKIADELGWNDMKDVARRSRMKQTRIEACEDDYQNNSQERTYQLLLMFVQEHSKNASNVLLQKLKESGKKDKAEKIREILSVGDQDGQNSSA